MVNTIKKLFDVLGFQISRTNTGPIYKFDSESKPVFVEFLGVSGVGKTTLFNTLKNNRTSKLNWIDREEFLNRHKLEKVNPLNALYNSILKEKVDSINASEYNLEDKIWYSYFFYMNLKEDSFLVDHNLNTTIINEDGLFHNFGKILYNNFQTDKSKLLQLLRNRIFVVCRNSPENIANQIVKRKSRNNEIRPQHKDLSLKQLIEIQIDHQNQLDELVIILKENSIPVLEIHTSDNISQLQSEINEFINIQQNEFKNIQSVY